MLQCAMLASHAAARAGTLLHAGTDDYVAYVRYAAVRSGHR